MLTYEARVCFQRPERLQRTGTVKWVIQISDLISSCKLSLASQQPGSVSVFRDAHSLSRTHTGSIRDSLGLLFLCLLSTKLGQPQHYGDLGSAGSDTQTSVVLAK